MAKVLQKKTPDSKPSILLKNKQLDRRKEQERKEQLERKKQARDILLLILSAETTY